MPAYKNLSLYDNMDFGHKKIKETAEHGRQNKIYNH